MKLVLYRENGMEGLALDQGQLQLVRRAMETFYEERMEYANQLALAAASPDVDVRLDNFRLHSEVMDDIETIEEFRSLLYSPEVYEKAKEA